MRIYKKKVHLCVFLRKLIRQYNRKYNRQRGGGMTGSKKYGEGREGGKQRERGKSDKNGGASYNPPFLGRRQRSLHLSLSLFHRKDWVKPAQLRTNKHKRLHVKITIRDLCIDTVATITSTLCSTSARGRFKQWTQCAMHAEGEGKCRIMQQLTH